MKLVSLRTLPRKAKTFVVGWGETKEQFATKRDRINFFKMWTKDRVRENLGRNASGPIKNFRLSTRIGGRPIKVFLRDNISDLLEFNAIFGRNLYHIDRKIKIDSILDLGSHIGLSSLFFSSEFPDARIECVEPVRENRVILKKNLSENKVNAGVHDFAIGGRNGSGRIFLSKPNAHSLHEESGKSREIDIKKIDFFDKDFDLIKFNIEGAEYDLFKTGKNKLTNAKCLIGQIHKSILGPEKSGEIIRWLESNFDVEYRTKGDYLNFVAYRKGLREDSSV